MTNSGYYRILADILQVKPVFETVPEEGYLDAHPECSGHLCHRAYDLSALAGCGIRLPETHLWEGLTEQVRWLETHP